MRLRLFSLWNLLTAPSGALQESKDLYQAQFLASLLLLFLPTLICLGVVVALKTLHQDEPLGRNVLWIAITSCGIAIAYGISRTRYYRWGALLLVITGVVMNFVSALTPAVINLSLFNYAVLILWLSRMFFPVWVLGIIFGVYMVGLVVIGFSIPSLDVEVVLTGPVVFMVFGFTILALIEWYRGKIAQEGQIVYRALFEQNQDAIFALNMKGRHFTVNQQASRLLGYTREEFKSINYREVVAPERRHISQEVIQRLLNGETIPIYEQIFIKKDGTRIPVEINVALVRDSFGRPLHIQSIVRDIRERKATEQALDQERALLRTLIDTLPDFVFIVDTDGRLMVCNRATLDRLGVTSEAEVLGKTDFDFYPPEIAQMLFDEDQEIMRTGQSKLNIERAALSPKPDSSIKWTTISKVPLRNKEGSIMGLLSVQHDITQLKESEAQRLELAVTRERVNVLQTFIREAISHDLRNPLALMRSSLYLLGRLEDPQKRQRHLDNLDRTLTDFEELIEDLLTISRFYQIGSVIIPEPVNLNALIESLLIGEREYANTRQQSVRFVPDTTLPIIEADPDALEKAIKHLVNNALKYSPEQSEVVIHTMIQGKFALVQVEDHGIGIGPHDLPYVFEPFFKADKSRPMGQSGTGIGLAIVKQVAEAHGGQVEVESALGEGSRFTLMLPLKKHPL